MQRPIDRPNRGSGRGSGIAMEPAEPFLDQTAALPAGSISGRIGPVPGLVFFTLGNAGRIDADHRGIGRDCHTLAAVRTTWSDRAVSGRLDRAWTRLDPAQIGPRTGAWVGGETLRRPSRRDGSRSRVSDTRRIRRCQLLLAIRGEVAADSCGRCGDVCGTGHRRRTDVRVAVCRSTALGTLPAQRDCDGGNHNRRVQFQSADATGRIFYPCRLARDPEPRGGG